MKHKTAELTGVLLDAAVAKASGIPVMIRTSVAGLSYCAHDSAWDIPYEPSTRWTYGGPIIERERIDIVQFDNGAVAFCGAHHELSAGGCLFDFEVHPADLAPTPLIAAMRAFVASKFGDEVDL